MSKEGKNHWTTGQPSTNFDTTGQPSTIGQPSTTFDNQENVICKTPVQCYVGWGFFALAFLVVVVLLICIKKFRNNETPRKAVTSEEEEILSPPVIKQPEEPGRHESTNLQNRGLVEGLQTFQ